MDVDDLILDVVELILVNLEGRTFTFELEDDQTTIVAYRDGKRGEMREGCCRLDGVPLTCGKKVQFWMSSQYPEAIMISSESSDSGTFGHIPHTNRFVFAIGQNQFLTRMEDSA